MAMPAMSCAFCREKEKNDDPCGELYVYDQLAAHHNCLLYSSGLFQVNDSSKGDDFEDFGGGFALKSVLKEIKRGAQFRCSRKSCRKKGATVGCNRKSCRATYHYLCSKEEGKFQQKWTEELSQNHINYEIIFCCKKHVIDLTRSSRSEMSSDEDNEVTLCDSESSSSSVLVSSLGHHDDSDDFEETPPRHHNNLSQNSKKSRNLTIISKLSRKKSKSGVEKRSPKKRKNSRSPRSKPPQKKLCLDADRDDVNGIVAGPSGHRDEMNEEMSSDPSSSSQQTAPILDEASLCLQITEATSQPSPEVSNAEAANRSSDLVATITRGVSQAVVPHFRQVQEEVDKLKKQMRTLKGEMAQLKGHRASPARRSDLSQNDQETRRHPLITSTPILVRRDVVDHQSDESDETLDISSWRKIQNDQQSLAESSDDADENCNRKVVVTRSRRQPFSDQVLANWYSLQNDDVSEREVAEIDTRWGVASGYYKRKLSPPFMPQGIRDRLGRISRDRDRALLEMCQGYHYAMAPLLSVTSSANNPSEVELKRAIEDTLTLTGSAAYKAATVRQKLIKEALPTEYRALCDYKPNHEFLFGDQLTPQKLEEVDMLVEENKEKKSQNRKGSKAKESQVKMRDISGYFK